MVIKNGNVLIFENNDVKVEKLDIRIETNKIEKMEMKKESYKGEKVIDATNKLDFSNSPL